MLVGPPAIEVGTLGWREVWELERQESRQQLNDSCRPEAGTDVRLVWSRSVGNPVRGAIDDVIEFDLKHCPNCGGELKIIAAILEKPVIEKILTHLGLQARDQFFVYAVSDADLGTLFQPQSIAAIPEPGTDALLCAGLAAIGWTARKGRR